MTHADPAPTTGRGTIPAARTSEQPPKSAANVYAPPPPPPRNPDGGSADRPTDPDPRVFPLKDIERRDQ